jgi:hypothetical protein
MTVEELIEELSKIEDKKLPVRVEDGSISIEYVEVYEDEVVLW